MVALRYAEINFVEVVTFWMLAVVRQTKYIATLLPNSSSGSPTKATELVRNDSTIHYTRQNVLVDRESSVSAGHSLRNCGRLSCLDRPSSADSFFTGAKSGCLWRLSGSHFVYSASAIGSVFWKVFLQEQS